MYFADGSRYRYTGDIPLLKAKNIGWLSSEHEYPKGEVPKAFIEKLRSFCATPVNKTRGYHQCDLCVGDGDFGRGPTQSGSLALGSAEIWVSHNRQTYAAPDLILHYVTEHKYRPPDEFVNAILNTLPRGRLGFFGRLFS